MRIGYYVHHHGRGHATRAGVIGGELVRRGHEVTFLGSAALPDVVGSTHVTLERDDRAEDAPFEDADVRGRLHWAPLGGGYARRSAQIASWVAEARPDVMVVDVSVEVTALARLLGVPVVVVGQPGRRDDDPHSLAFDVATAVLAPWPEELDVAPHLDVHRDRVFAVGGITRFEGAAADHAAQQADPRITHNRSSGEESLPVGVLLVGGEGWDDPDLPGAVRMAVPEVDWRTPDADHPVDGLLSVARVVVTHAGQNAVADVAAFGVPAVVLPQERPFGEQADTARALNAAGIACGLPVGTDVAAVREAVREVLAEDDDRARGRAWQRWRVGGATARAADVVEQAARNDSSDDDPERTVEANRE